MERPAGAAAAGRDRIALTAGTQSESATLSRVLLRHVRDAWPDDAAIDREWAALRFSARPDRARAVAEYDAFVDLLTRGGADATFVTGPAVGLDSVYVRDAAVLCARGAILARMGKAARSAEPAALEPALARLGVPIVGRIEGDGRLEGGDVVWLDDRTVAVGEGYRTNAEGIRQLRALLRDLADEIVTVPLPHWRGPDDVFHLMSIFSPLDADLALVHSPLLPVPFREWLRARGVILVDVAPAEFDTLGCNVLAVGPRRCVMVAGNPLTRARLEGAGCEVREFAGAEICATGGGGPTCLTLPLARLTSFPPPAA